MKKLFSLILAIGILVPISSLAFKSDIGDNLNITTPSQEDYYIAGARINVNSNNDGDLIIAGGKISINGNTKENLMIAGGENFINGNIGKSARIVGGTIIMEGNIQKDLLVAGAKIDIKEGTNIQGYTKIVGSQIEFSATSNDTELIAEEIIIHGTIKGDAKIKSKTIIITTGAKILGNLYYESPNESSILEEITAGQITFQQKNFKNQKKFLGIFKTFVSTRLAFLVIFGLILLLTAHQYIKPSIETLNKHPLQSLGIGFLIYAGLPFIAILFAITVIGIPFSLLSIMLFIALIMFAKLINVYFYSNFFIEKRGGHDKLNNRKKIGILLVCAILSAILSVIDIIFTFFALGAITKTHILQKK